MGFFSGQASNSRLDKGTIPAEMRWIGITFLLLLMVSGCQRPEDNNEPAPLIEIAPLAMQQAEAYPETETGLFVGLVDFEDVSDGPRGFEQVRHFHIDPIGHEGYRKFAANITRTGVGAMEVRLGPGNELVFNSPEVHDFKGYMLLSFALYSEGLRDDLRVTLVSDGGSWKSPPVLVLPGWNNVLIDIQRLAQYRDFDVRHVRQVRLAFADSVGDVTFNIDDIMLIDNRRDLKSTAKGYRLHKVGLDYELTQPQGHPKLKLAQQTDGLWRWTQRQPVIWLGDANQAPTGKEDLRKMGARKVGRVEILETNPVRIRLRNTWYFPTRGGEWASLAIRRIGWEETFYRDGRRVTQVEVNNSGGQRISQVGLWLGGIAAWSDGAEGDGRIEPEFQGPVVRWSYLQTRQADSAKVLRRSYMNPGRVEVLLGKTEAYAAGDEDSDRFDQTRGCYFLQAADNGHCRFVLHPGRDGVVNPVFRVAGRWSGKVSVNASGLGVRDFARLKDGSVLWMLEGEFTSPLRIEVWGRPDDLVE